jgi:hypothetical protein
MMNTTRSPDFYVLAESGVRVPCFIQGQLCEHDSHILIGFQAGARESSLFLIDSKQLRLMTWSKTVLDIEIEPAMTEVWKALTDF